MARSVAHAVHHLSSHISGGTTYINIHVNDYYGRNLRIFERQLFRSLVNSMERYLAHRPNITFTHPKNRVRQLIYRSATMKVWARYMPGGFATHYVHNPDHKRLISGERIDYITRSLFRHSADAIGLRARLYASSWFLNTVLPRDKTVIWLSLGSGTGQATFDAICELERPVIITLTDIDSAALKFARELGYSYKLGHSTFTTRQLDIHDAVAYRRLIKSLQPTVIEAMGVMEYIDDTMFISFIKSTREQATPNSYILFSNMLPTHPHLRVHKRGLGWPGVIVRSTAEVRHLLKAAGIQLSQLTILLPDDHVYAVYAIMA